MVEILRLKITLRGDLLSLLKKKSQGQITIQKKLTAILNKAGKSENQKREFILEKFEPKKKLSTLVNSLELALRHKSFIVFTILWNKLTTDQQTKCLLTYDLLEQTVMAEDSKQLIEILKLYKDMDVATVLSNLTEEAYGRFYKGYFTTYSNFDILLSKGVDPDQLIACLKPHGLLERAVISEVDSQLVEILKIYEHMDVKIKLKQPWLSEQALQILHGGSWNQETIAAVYPYLPSFLIPRGQEKAKMYATVCYNRFYDQPTGQVKRHGAKAESDCIIKALKVCGFTVEGPKIDWSFRELLEYLEKLIHQIKDKCSVLFIFIMSHGDQGVLYDKKGKTGDISMVIKKLDELKNIIPAVVFIQACQGNRVPREHTCVTYNRSLSDGLLSETDAFTTGIQSAESSNQPHSHGDSEVLPYMYGHHVFFLRINTMVVMATTEHTFAKRHVFFEHLASQLEFADGSTTINSMVQLCSKEMSLAKDEETRRQAPLSRDILRQPLILPRARARQVQCSGTQQAAGLSVDAVVHTAKAVARKYIPGAKKFLGEN